MRSIHEVAQAAAPGSTVVHADNDPVAPAHARAMLVSTGKLGVDRR